MIKLQGCKQTSSIKYLFLWLFISFFLTSCNQDQTDHAETAPSKAIPILNDKNIGKLSLELAYDHYKQLDSLVKGFKSHKKAKDSYGFTQFRNFKWTPAYIEKKDYYSAIREKNKAYLTNSPAMTLFTGFENIIYIGINLKNAFLDDNRVLLIQTLKEIKQDQNTVLLTMKTMGLESKFEELKAGHTSMFSPDKK